MNAAYTTPTIERDPFAEARAQLDTMERHLRSPATLQLGHQELEAYLRREGRELQRLLMQGHGDLRGERAVRLVEVRGYVLEARGPLIEVSHPEQIEVLR